VLSEFLKLAGMRQSSTMFLFQRLSSNFAHQFFLTLSILETEQLKRRQVGTCQMILFATFLLQRLGIIWLVRLPCCSSMAGKCSMLSLYASVIKSITFPNHSRHWRQSEVCHNIHLMKTTPEE
jgi:hypothetical protein